MCHNHVNVNTTDMWLVYRSDSGNLYYQPWDDLVESLW